jgi:hypothetical protein
VVEVRRDLAAPSTRSNAHARAANHAPAPDPWRPLRPRSPAVDGDYSRGDLERSTGSVTDAAVDGRREPATTSPSEKHFHFVGPNRNRCLLGARDSAMSPAIYRNDGGGGNRTRERFRSTRTTPIDTKAAQRETKASAPLPPLQTRAPTRRDVHRRPPSCLPRRLCEDAARQDGRTGTSAGEGRRIRGARGQDVPRRRPASKAPAKREAHGLGHGSCTKASGWVGFTRRRRRAGRKDGPRPRETRRRPRKGRAGGASVVDRGLQPRGKASPGRA